MRNSYLDAVCEQAWSRGCTLDEEGAVAPAVHGDAVKSLHRMVSVSVVVCCTAADFATMVMVDLLLDELPHPVTDVSRMAAMPSDSSPVSLLRLPRSSHAPKRKHARTFSPVC